MASYTPSQRITSIIYSKVLSKQLEKLRESRDPKVIYITDLVSCSHKHHLRKYFPELLLGFEPPLVLGDLVHLGLEKMLSESSFETEVEIEGAVVLEGNEYVIKGRVDAINREEGIAVEIKTSRSGIFLPKENHIEQLNIYLNMLGYGKGILIYITPDKLVEYEIERTALDIESIVRETLEDKAHPRYEWECKYCVYRKICPYYEREKGESVMSSG